LQISFEFRETGKNDDWRHKVTIKLPKAAVQTTNLVIAPARKVHIPVVQRKFNVADSVRHIEADIATLFTSIEHIF